MGTFTKNDSKAPNVKTIAYPRIKTLITQTHNKPAEVWYSLQRRSLPWWVPGAHDHIRKGRNEDQEEVVHGKDNWDLHVFVGKK